MSFDPNAPAPKNSGIYGLPTLEADAALVLLPVPWEATTSYGGGAAEGPAAILEASKQVDLFDLDVDKPYEAGIAMAAAPDELAAWNERAKELAQKIIREDDDVQEPGARAKVLGEVEALGAKVNAWVDRETTRLLDAGKIVGVVGGDHSAPLGAIEAAARRFGSFGVLHVDAHSDTRDAYEGFRFSHASIMRNVLDAVPGVEKLVQLAIRDVCEEEMEYVRAAGDRVVVFDDRQVSRDKARGASWHAIAERIVAALPNRVWISFDIDGLDPKLCPHTGTPVPGGIELAEATYLMSMIVSAKKTIVGFDLCEVAPNLEDESDEWDANVGARLLYKMCGFTLASQGRAALRG
jgi:agmatinase